MEGKGLYTILLAIIAVLALALAVLVIFLFVAWNPNNSASDNNQPSDIVEVEVPPDQLEAFVIIKEEENKYFNLKSTTEYPEAVIIIGLSVKCDVGSKKKNSAEVKDLVEVQYNTELREAIAQYLNTITFEEAQNLETQFKAKDDLKKKFNEILNQGNKEKKQYVQQVTLYPWFTQG